MWPFANSQVRDVTCLITMQLNWSHTLSVYALIGHVHSMYVTVINLKRAIITVITN